MSTSSNIKIETHLGIDVLRDDLLPGGTKSILLDALPKAKEYVYASPVYGGFQVALAKRFKSKAVIFCARRAIKHSNTLMCLNYGAKVIEIDCGYMSVLEARAREYGGYKIPFGAKFEGSKELLVARVKQVVGKKEPDEIWCAIGSGLLFESILAGTKKCKVVGVQVGKEYVISHKRGRVIVYPKPFEKISSFKAPFPSMPNYDLKAFEMCVKAGGKNRLFWNVL